MLIPTNHELSTGATDTKKIKLCNTFFSRNRFHKIFKKKWQKRYTFSPKFSKKFNKQINRRLEIEPDFYSQQVDDILDGRDDYADDDDDDVKADPAKEEKIRILQNEIEFAKEKMHEDTQMRKQIGENGSGDLHEAVEPSITMNDLKPDNFLLYDKLDQNFRNSEFYNFNRYTPHIFCIYIFRI